MSAMPAEISYLLAMADTTSESSIPSLLNKADLSGESSTSDEDSTYVSNPRRAKWIDRISAQGPWDESTDPLSLRGAPSLPMPVEVSDEASLAPFLEHLRKDGTHEAADAGVAGFEPYYETDFLEFKKGVLYADGRVDLCKMATGPRNIGDLMDSLRSNHFAKHFLLGNNIIGPTGAKAIADFIKEKPDQFETWYLAGNCIDAASFGILVDAMVQSKVITNVWLKRNPLMAESASDVFRLVEHSPVLRTLDLDQTELGDDGVAQLFRLLAKLEKPIALRHIYLNAVGIGARACQAISDYLCSPHCGLESLYMSSNPVGQSVTLLGPGIKSNRTIQRLSLQSCGLDDNVSHLLEAVTGHPSLKVLDIGQAYATEDLGMRFNWITDVSAPALENATRATNLQYLNISYTPMTQTALNSIYDAVLSSKSILWFYAHPLVKGGKSYEAVKAGQKSKRMLQQVREHLSANVAAQYDGKSYQAFENSEKRFLLSPRDVRFIDSVYRNRDAGLARRGMKELQKYWAEGDDTLWRVQHELVFTREKGGWMDYASDRDDVGRW